MLSSEANGRSASSRYTLLTFVISAKNNEEAALAMGVGFAGRGAAACIPAGEAGRPSAVVFDAAFACEVYEKLYPVPSFEVFVLFDCFYVRSQLMIISIPLFPGFCAKLL